MRTSHTRKSRSLSRLPLRLMAWALMGVMSASTYAPLVATVSAQNDQTATPATRKTRKPANRNSSVRSVRSQQPSASSGMKDINPEALRQIEALLEEKEQRTAAQQKLDSQLIYTAHQHLNRKSSAAANIQLPPTSVKVTDEGLTLVDITATVDKQILDLITQTGGKVVNSFPNEQAIRAYVALDALEAVAALEGVKFIQPAVDFMTNEIEPKTGGGNTGGSSPFGAGGDTPLPGNHPLMKSTAPNVAPKTPARTPSSDRKPSGTSKLNLSPFADSLALNPVGNLAANDSASGNDFASRAARVRENLNSALPVIANRKAGAAALQQTTMPNITGAIVSEADTAHRAREGRRQFKATGSGIKIGVLSDSIEALDQLQRQGELPSDVIVLPGQAGSGSSEGTAMMELIHDLAPGAQLYFASAFGGVANFADNIRRLRAEGCDIIVDDVLYFNESPFQDGPIARAVIDVTNSGALYFSSAGNSGNKNDNTSGVWEGDFADGGAVTLTIRNANGTTRTVSGRAHDFDPGPGVAIQNPVFRTSSLARPATLFWSDPLGASTNDYDLFLISETGTSVVAASTTVQNGSQDPYEALTVPAAPQPSGRRILILKANSAQPRFLHISLNRNRFASSTPNALIPAFSTDGQTRGHNSAPEAFGTAAVDVATARGGAFTGGAANPVETFSSDGFRRVFYNPDGTPIRTNADGTPNVLAATNGGEIRIKPLIAAADGASTATPDFEQFFGTSAAAPHAAAIAGLVKSGNPQLSKTQIRDALLSTALDIEAPGIDRDSGYGIVMAQPAMQATNAQPSPALLDRFAPNGVIIAASGPDNDQFIEAGESGVAFVDLANRGGLTAGSVSATISTTTPGVTITQATAAYPDIPQESVARNLTPFRFSLDANAFCGTRIVFTMTISYTNGLSPRTITFVAQTGQPSLADNATRFRYNGPAAAIPDGPLNGDQTGNVGVSIPINVSGINGAIQDLNFSFDGTECTAEAGATTVGLDHTFVGDLVVTLTSPQGTTLILMNQPGGNNTGNNFCNTLLDDSATRLIQNITPAEAPYTGSYKPASPLSIFQGENPNGTWTLKVVDLFPTDTGNVRAFSLYVSPFTCENNTPQISIAPTFCRDATTGEYVATLSITNNSDTPARNIRINTATLGTTAGTPVPQFAQPSTVSRGETGRVTIRFPASVGAPGTRTVLRFTGEFDGGIFSDSSRVALPSQSCPN